MNVCSGGHFLTRPESDLGRKQSPNNQYRPPPARRLAAEALAFHIDGLVEDGEAIPAPSSLDSVMADAHNRDAVAILVDLPARSARSLRVNVTLPEDILKAIDQVTTNRSRFLADAAREKLRRI